MPVELTWLYEPRVLLVDIDNEITMLDIRHLNAAVTSFLDSTALPVHVIVECSNMNAFPTRVSDIADVATGIQHSRLGWLLIVGAKRSITTMLLRILSQLVPLRYRMMDARADAYRFLISRDATLEAPLTVLINAALSNGNNEDGPERE